MAAKDLLHLPNQRDHRFRFGRGDVEVIPDDVRGAGAALAEEFIEPAETAALGGRRRDDDDRRIDLLQHDGRLAHELHHRCHGSRVELLQVGLVPDLIVAHPSPIPAGNRPHVVPPVLQIGRLRRGPGPVGRHFAWPGRGPRGRHAQRQEDLDVALARELHVTVERLEPPLARLRLEISPGDVRVPQPPRAESAGRPRRQRTGAMDVEPPVLARDRAVISADLRRAALSSAGMGQQKDGSAHDGAPEHSLTAHRHARWRR